MEYPVQGIFIDYDIIQGIAIALMHSVFEQAGLQHQTVFNDDRTGDDLLQRFLRLVFRQFSQESEMP